MGFSYSSAAPEYPFSFCLLLQRFFTSVIGFSESEEKNLPHEACRCSCKPEIILFQAEFIQWVNKIDVFSLHVNNLFIEKYLLSF